MNKLTLIGMAGLTALFVAAGCAKEQPGDSPDARCTHRHGAMGHMAGHGMTDAPGALYELLDLDEAQKAKVAAILEANAPERSFAGKRRDGRHGDGRPGEKRMGDGTCAEPGAHRHGSGPGDGRPWDHGRCDGPCDEPGAKDLKAHRDKVHAEIMAVLTPAQKEKAEALKAQLDKGVIPQELIDLRIRKLDGLLELSDDQKAKLAALMQEKGGKLKECRSKHRELGRAYMDGVKGILTAAQWETYTERFRRHFHDGRDGRFGHMRGIMRDLDLTDAQKDQLKAIMKKAFKDDKAPRGDHEAMQAHHDKVRTEIRAILTAEQQKKFDTMKPPMDGPHGRYHKHDCKGGGDCKG